MYDLDYLERALVRDKNKTCERNWTRLLSIVPRWTGVAFVALHFQAAGAKVHSIQRLVTVKVRVETL